MNPRRLLRHLGPGIVGAALLLLLGGGLYHFAATQFERAQAEQGRARDLARTLHQRYQQAQANEPDLRQSIARFEQFRRQGLIGPENRLEWAAALHIIGQNRALGPLDFTLAPQHPLAKLDPAGTYTSKASSMKLRLALLHEGDLLRVLADLHGLPGVLVTPRHCSLADQPGEGRTEGLTAECELDWITVDTAPRPPQP